MRVLVTGVNGQLGYDVMKELTKRGHEGIGTGSAQMDITDQAAVENTFRKIMPERVVHCAAWTAVDAAEDETELCRRINALGTEHIAGMCRELDIPMIYISTDYVFNGQGERPWEPDDEREPLNVYGRTKYEGELAVEKYLEKYYIVRIAWVFGINGKNFVKTMLNLSETRDTLTVVDDQIGSPTYTKDLARLLVDMLETDQYGHYHATNEGNCSWCEFAKEIFRQAGKEVTVLPVTSDQYPAKARRPQNSRMNKDKLEKMGFERLPSWQNALERYLKEIAESHEEL